MLWDIFCKVIDNHGDIGVCWRLASQLAARGEAVRLWVDDSSALAWMASADVAGVEVRPWQEPVASNIEPGDVVIEAFGCELDATFQAAIARKSPPPAWINLEYLTAESFAARSHGLPSPVLAGPAAGLTKFFFYPGFAPETGGLLREPDLEARQGQFDASKWLRSIGVAPAIGAKRASLFCYEPPLLPEFLSQLGASADPIQLLVTAGRAAAAVRTALDTLARERPAWNAGAALAIEWLPLLSQRDFDHLLWSCDLNFVRGEDSLVRALWAGKPFVWHIYPQHDDAHHAKLEAFLDWLEAPASQRDFHRGWNAMAPALPAPDTPAWAACASGARDRLLQHEELVTKLVRFVQDQKTLK